jgi:glycosyltransferase involved in cell wall biosynthesis
MSNIFESQQNFPDVVQINMGKHGGAWQVAKRLNSALIEFGINSELKNLIDMKHLPSNLIYKFGSKIDYEIQKYQKQSSTTTLMTGVGSSKLLLNLIDKIPTNKILHIHWVPGALSHELMNVLEKRKVVLTLHDMRYLTGYCHHAGNCTGYLVACNFCPQAPKLVHNIISRSFEAFSNSKDLRQDFKVIVPSRWLFNIAKVALPTRDLQLHQIYNLIPEKIFNLNARKTFIKNPNRIRFCMSGSQNPGKGGRDALLLISRISKHLKFNFDVFIFGNRHEGFPEIVQQEVKEIQNEEEFAKLLGSMDFLFHLSESENSPNLVREAQAVGVSVIASDVGGTKELILSEKTGLFVNASDQEIVNFINSRINSLDKSSKDSFSESLTELSSNYILNEHVKIYQSFSSEN